MPTLRNPELSPSELGFITALTIGILGALTIYEIIVPKDTRKQNEYLISCIIGAGIHYIVLGFPV